MRENYSTSILTTTFLTLAAGAPASTRQHFARPEHHKIPFAQHHHGFPARLPAGTMSLSASQSVSGVPCGKVLKVILPDPSAQSDPDKVCMGIQHDARRTAGSCPRNQIKTGLLPLMSCLPVGDAVAAWALTCSMARRSSSGSGTEMMNIANNHDTTLRLKHCFIFMFYTRIVSSIPIARQDLRQRMFIGKCVNPLLIALGILCGGYA